MLDCTLRLPLKGVMGFLREGFGLWGLRFEISLRGSRSLRVASLLIPAALKTSKTQKLTAPSVQDPRLKTPLKAPNLEILKPQNPYVGVSSFGV